MSNSVACTSRTQKYATRQSAEQRAGSVRRWNTSTHQKVSRKMLVLTLELLLLLPLFMSLCMQSACFRGFFRWCQWLIHCLNISKDSNTWNWKNLHYTQVTLRQHQCNPNAQPTFKSWGQNCEAPLCLSSSMPGFDSTSQASENVVRLVNETCSA